MSIKSNYWSCSKLADAIRGTAKPNAATMQEWNQWEIEAKKTNPIRYWIVEKGLSSLQDIVCYVPDKINDFRYYLNNRFYTKTHALTSNLPRGKFYEFDTKVLHCLFDELVNFIEIEKAAISIAFSKRKQCNCKKCITEQQESTD